MKILLTLLLLTAPIAVSAQSIEVDFGKYAEFREFTLERDSMTGIGTLIMHLTPSFNPEPHGPVPPADVAKMHQSVCERIAPLNADLMVDNNASRFGVRWDWTPAQQNDNGITISRFHRNDFEVNGAECSLIWGVTPEFTPTLSGITPRLLYTATQADQRMNGLGLEMVYDLGAPLDEGAAEFRARVALELCLTAATVERQRREENYRDLRYSYIAITFEERVTPNQTQRDSHVLALDGGECINSLPQDEIDAIRAAAQ